MDPAITLEHDLRIILAIQSLRAFGYGFASVVLGSSLADGGLSDGQVGLVFAAILAGNALVSIAIGLAGDRIGRRRAYVLLLFVMSAAGVAYALSDSVPVLVLVALTGTLSTDANESGPLTSLEQAMLGGAPPEVRARVFGRYNAIAYLAGAVGALAGGGPAVIRQRIPNLPTDQRWLLVLTLAGVLCVALTRRLSTAIDRRAGRRTAPLQRSRTEVSRLAVLFGLDAFAGGFVVSTFLVFWFGRRFGASAELMGLVLFCSGLLQAVSSIASGWLATRIGLLTTMVFTHLPSNVLLILIPVMPTLGSAIAMLLLRSTLSQMDVPARQAYVTALVEPEERTAAAAFTNTARYMARPFGAAGAGLLMQSVAVGAPFVVAGVLKSLYDVLVFARFRRVPLPEDHRGDRTETETSAEPPGR
ncbi:MAG TPA: MFS transporter [Actinomycetota bacterium]|nr:MFS transporter [Actinomycetota bacterium]